MNEAGRAVYHSKRYKRTMSGDMLLWTIIDKTVYLEFSPFKEPDFVGAHYDQIAAWYGHIQSVIELPGFPRSLQFWTRIGCDYVPVEDYNNVRVDLLYP
jgi:hypothetical protein